MAGNHLDGEWINPPSTTPPPSVYPSGDGIAGGDFLFRFNVLPGDVNQNGYVQATDGLLVRGALGSSAGQPAYSIFKDLNGNGYIQSNDGLLARGRLGANLPQGEPTADPFPADALIAAAALQTVSSNPSSAGSLLYSLPAGPQLAATQTLLLVQPTIAASSTIVSSTKASSTTVSSMAVSSPAVSTLAASTSTASVLPVSLSLVLTSAISTSAISTSAVASLVVSSSANIKPLATIVPLVFISSDSEGGSKLPSSISPITFVQQPHSSLNSILGAESNAAKNIADYALLSINQQSDAIDNDDESLIIVLADKRRLTWMPQSIDSVFLKIQNWVDGDEIL